MTLVEFLRARLDEDEQTARDALAVSGAGDWALDDLGKLYSPSLDREVTAGGMTFADHAMVAETPDECFHPVFSDQRAAEHCIRHDPKRVLAEVDAKRRLLDWLDNLDEWLDGDRLASPEYAYSNPARKLLALPSADHPDYDESWRP